MTDKSTVRIAEIVDHREIVITKVTYTVKELAAFLGISYFAAQRLVQGDTPKIPSRNTGRRYIISGAAIIDYLNGADQPMKHPESA